MICLSRLLPLRVEQSCSCPLELQTVVVKSKLSTLPVPELTIGHNLLPVHSTFCLTDCMLVLCCNVTLLPQSSKEVFTPKLYVFLNNQPDTLIIPILFCYTTLHVSGIFSAHHQEFSTVYSALVSFMQVSDDHFRAESGWMELQFHPDSPWESSSETCFILL